MQLQCSIDNSILLCNGGPWYHSPCPHRATHTLEEEEEEEHCILLSKEPIGTQSTSLPLHSSSIIPSRVPVSKVQATALDDLFSFLFCVFCGTWIASYIAFPCLVAHSNISATSTKDATGERSPLVNGTSLVHDPTNQITYSSRVRAHMTESRPRDNRTLHGMPGASAHFPLIVVLSPVKWCLFAKEERAHLHTVSSYSGVCLLNSTNPARTSPIIFTISLWKVSVPLPNGLLAIHEAFHQHKVYESCIQSSTCVVVVPNNAFWRPERR